MHILLCNDDGLDSPGLAALHRACRSLGQVSVVAPATEQSTTGHSLTLRDPVRVREHLHPAFGRTFAVEGTPADCVRLAVAELVEPPVDLVASGINRGANLGVDVYYSGTVAGAREAAILGLPAVAVSQFVARGQGVDWDRAAWLTERVLREWLSACGAWNGGRPGAGIRLWNVNLPVARPDKPELSVCVVPHSTDPMPNQYCRSAEDQPPSYTYCGPYMERVARAGTDVATVFAGDIAVTPLSLGSTHEAALEVPLGLTLHEPGSGAFNDRSSDPADRRF
jgi:5'-nucleotidase